MKYIKLYENHDSNDEDIKYILGDYYHDDKCEIINNNYYKLYKFENLNYYSEACIELDKHSLEYRSVNVKNKIGYIIQYLSYEILKCLDELFKNIKTREDKYLVYYFKFPNKFYIEKYYSKVDSAFFIANYIWSLISNKFNLDYSNMQTITTWYIKEKIQKECLYTTNIGIYADDLVSSRFRKLI